MIFKRYLVINSRGTARITKSRPYIKGDEIALLLNLELPKELFEKPMLEATVTIPQNAVSKPVIKGEVVDNVQEAIEKATGLKVSLRIVEPEDDIENLDAGL